jgi:short subunit fatty acids transporter
VDRALGAGRVHLCFARDGGHRNRGLDRDVAADGRLIRRVAGWPESPRAAVALVTLFALASSWLNWGFSLAFSAVLSREVARRVKGVDYRALGAASFLGLGSSGRKA